MGPTGDGSQHIGDEHLHQRLVQQVVALPGPAQYRLKLAQRHQARLGQALLRLVVPGRGHAPKSPSQTHSQPDVWVASDRAEVSDLQAERLRLAALAEPPEGFPERLHQGELEVDHHVQNGLQGESNAQSQTLSQHLQR